MRDVGMAAQPELSLVRGVAELVGFLDAADVARLEVAEVLPEIGDGDGGHVQQMANHPGASRHPSLKKEGRAKEDVSLSQSAFTRCGRGSGIPRRPCPLRFRAMR